MIETKDTNRSLLIPKWLSVRTSQIEDFIYSKQGILVDASKEVSNIQNDYKDFKSEPNLTKAAELLNTSIVLNELDISRDIADYIITNSSKNNEPLFTFAKKVLNVDEEDAPKLTLNKQIGQLKKMLRQFPHDPLMWIELARTYTIKNQLKKAQKALSVALTLTPGNRFVTRSASRFFVHVDRPDLATQLLRRAYTINSDPMILSMLTNCSIIEGRTPKEFRKPSLEIPDHMINQNSELLATAAILEMRAGNHRRAKKFFRKGWLAPTENVIAHAEWIIRNHYPSVETGCSVDFNRSAEASTWRFFHLLELEKAIKMAKIWCLEEPYSTHPFTCGSSFACDAEDYKNAVIFASKGLKANPYDKMLQNNYVFALLKLNKLDKAEQLLNAITIDENDSLSATIEATRGYSYYKRGNIEKGRLSYLNALSKFKKKRDKDFFIAFLYFAISEQEVNTDMAEKFIIEALQLSEGCNDPRILVLRNKLLKLDQ